MFLEEKSFFFQNDGYKLFGFLHAPNLAYSSKAIIFCPPFGEEKQECHRAMVNLARKLAENGFIIFRFDYFGTGDSQGEWQDATVNRWLSDISAAIHWIRNACNFNSLGLLGLRFGATLAALAVEENPSIDFIILLQPVVNGQKYLYECLRSNLSTQMVIYREVRFNREKLLQNLSMGENIDLDGYPLTKEFYESTKNIHLFNCVKAFKGNNLIVQLTAKNSRSSEELLSLHSIYCANNPKSKFLTLPGHAFWNEPLKHYNDSPEVLFDQTLRWLKSLS